MPPAGNPIPPLRTVLSARERRRSSTLFALEHFFGSERVRARMAGRYDRLRQALASAVAKTGPATAHSIPAVDDLSTEAFHRDFAAAGRPVVFKGAGLTWEACQTWTFASLAANYGDVPVTLVNDDAFGGRGSPAHEVTTLGELLGTVDDEHGPSPDRYARFHPLVERHPELQAHLDLQWLQHKRYRPLGNGYPFNALFLGGKGSTTPIHNAGNENLFLQVTGRKTWRLWPADYRYLFDVHANRAPAKHAEFNPSKPDYQRYPALQFADYYQVDLEPGDILYVPAYVWHHVTNHSASIGASMRWTSLANNLRQDKLLLVFEFLNTRPTLYKTMWPDKPFDFNDILVSGIGEP